MGLATPLVLCRFLELLSKQLTSQPPYCPWGTALGTALSSLSPQENLRSKVEGTILNTKGISLCLLVKNDPTEQSEAST